MSRVLAVPVSSKVNRSYFNMGAELKSKLSRLISPKERDYNLPKDTFCRQNKASAKSTKEPLTPEKVVEFLTNIMNEEGGEAVNGRFNSYNIKNLSKSIKTPHQRELLLKLASIKELEAFDLNSICSSANTPNEAKLIEGLVKNKNLNEKIQILNNIFANDWKASAIDSPFKAYTLNLQARALEKKIEPDDIDLDRICDLNRLLKANRATISTSQTNLVSDANISSIFSASMFKAMKVLDNDLILYAASKDKLKELGTFIQGVTQVVERIGDKNAQALRRTFDKMESPKKKYQNLKSILIMQKSYITEDELLEAVKSIGDNDKFANILKKHMFEMVGADVSPELAQRISFNERYFPNVFSLAHSEIKFRKEFKKFIKNLQDPNRASDKVLKQFCADLQRIKVFDGEEINYQNFIAVKSEQKINHKHR